jgi:hypothetical protein
VDDAELKMGSSEKTILNYFHPDAVELFNITSNLRRVCQELKDPTTTLSARVTPSLATRRPTLVSDPFGRVCAGACVVVRYVS